MDVHVFANSNISQDACSWSDWEQRLRTKKGSIYTSTSTLVKSRVFLSYARADVVFAKKLEKKLREIGVDCWRDEHNLVSGRISKQLQRAILDNDVLLVILSKDSLSSDWVTCELASAREKEKKLGRDVICPIALDSSWTSWTDDPVLKREVEKYHVVSFDEHEKGSAFDECFDRLITGLRENYGFSDSGADQGRSS